MLCFYRRTLHSSQNRRCLLIVPSTLMKKTIQPLLPSSFSIRTYPPTYYMASNSVKIRNILNANLNQSPPNEIADAFKPSLGAKDNYSDYHSDIIYISRPLFQTDTNLNCLMQSLLPPTAQMKLVEFRECTKEGVAQGIESAKDVKLADFKKSLPSWIANNLNCHLLQLVKRFANVQLPDIDSYNLINILAEHEMKYSNEKKNGFSIVEFNFEIKDMGKVTGKLSQYNGKQVANSTDDFLPNQQLRDPNSTIVLSRDDTWKIRKELSNLGSKLKFVVNEIKTEHHELQPFSPFTIRSLITFMPKLQDYSSTLVMFAINQLYQLGYISIVNTDCMEHSSKVKDAAIESIRLEFGDEQLQHILDTNSNALFNIGTIHPVIVDNKFIPPSEINHKEIDDKILKVYSAIYYNTLTSIMQPAHFNSVDVEIRPDAQSQELLQKEIGTKSTNLCFIGSVKQVTHYGHLITKAKLMRLYEHHELNPSISISSNDPNFVKVLAEMPLTTDLFISENEYYNHHKLFERFTIMNHHSKISNIETKIDMTSSEEFSQLIVAPYKEFRLLNEFEKLGFNFDSTIIAIRELRKFGFIQNHKTINLTFKSLFVNQVLMKEISKFLPIFKKMSEIQFITEEKELKDENNNNDNNHNDNNDSYNAFKACIIDFEKAFKDLSMINETDYRLTLDNYMMNGSHDFFFNNMKFFVTPTGEHMDNSTELHWKLLDEPWQSNKTRKFITSLIQKSIVSISEILQKEDNLSIKEVARKYKCVKLMNCPDTKNPILLEEHKKRLNIIITIFSNVQKHAFNQFIPIPKNFLSKSIKELSEEEILKLLGGKSNTILIYNDKEYAMNVYASTDNDGKNPYISFAGMKIKLDNDQNIKELTKLKTMGIVHSYLNEKRIFCVFNSKLGWIRVLKNQNDQLVARVTKYNMHHEFILPSTFQNAPKHDFKSPNLQSVMVEGLENILMSSKQKDISTK